MQIPLSEGGRADTGSAGARMKVSMSPAGDEEFGIDDAYRRPIRRISSDPVVLIDTAPIQPSDSATLVLMPAERFRTASLMAAWHGARPPVRQLSSAVSSAS